MVCSVTSVDHGARVRVAVIFGGRSSEHSISCLSAASVLAALDRTRYDVTAIGISRTGTWHRVSNDPTDWVRHGDRLPSITGDEPSVAFSLEPHTSTTSASTIGVDVVFPVLHGPFGEDGTIQGALELAQVPYVGSGVLASAATMDKQATKLLLAASGLPVGRHVAISDNTWVRDREEALEQIAALRFPIFVKPARAGSSVGISKVRDFDGVPAAIEEARKQDRKLIVEESVEHAREIECGVLASAGHEPPWSSRCAEITVHGGHEFYDFDAKYMDDSATLTVPADLPDAVHKELGELAVRAFDAMGCDGLARVDFFLDEDGDVVINEINTMPGFTSISLFPRMWEDSGITYPELVDHLIKIALDRGTGLK
ncbi:MAG: D-alanine--D-alanine ligase family protein [Candidatus Nanopelagicales bacterium]